MTGLIPGGDRFAIASAYAAFTDWWNVNGLTARDIKRGRDRPSASVQLSRMRYSPGCGSYFEREDATAVEIYLGLVHKYHPEKYEEEKKEWWSE